MHFIILELFWFLNWCKTIGIAVIIIKWENYVPVPPLAHGSSHGPIIPAGYTGQPTNQIRFPIHTGGEPVSIQVDLFANLGGMLF